MKILHFFFKCAAKVTLPYLIQVQRPSKSVTILFAQFSIVTHTWPPVLHSPMKHDSKYAVILRWSSLLCEGSTAPLNGEHGSTTSTIQFINITISVQYIIKGNISQPYTATTPTYLIQTMISWTEMLFIHYACPDECRVGPSDNV